MKRLFLTVFLAVFLTLPTMVLAGSVTLSWEAPTTKTDGTELTDLAGYKVYQGKKSRTYGTPIDVGNETTYTITDLPDGAFFYAAVTAYDASGLESEYSNEVDNVPPKAPTINITVNININ